jgi:hypothetical protein
MAEFSRQTHCKHGHEYTPENTYMHAFKRYCRACANARFRKRTKKTRSDRQVYQHGTPEMKAFARLPTYELSLARTPGVLICSLSLD